jgi:sortase A
MKINEGTKTALVNSERLLWFVGSTVVVFGLFTGLQAYAARQSAQNFPPLVGSPTQNSIAVTTPDSQVIGRIDIPQLALSVPMMAGYDSSSLLRGVGHINGTAMPGGLGTLGLAGHRDTYFKPLRKIATDMEIKVIDRSGTYHYVVDFTEIVSPERVDVLDIGARPELTLITCFPFDYIGAAPKRFIVHAHLISVAADKAS